MAGVGEKTARELIRSAGLEPAGLDGSAAAVVADITVDRGGAAQAGGSVADASSSWS